MAVVKAKTFVSARLTETGGTNFGNFTVFDSDLNTFLATFNPEDILDINFSYLPIGKSGAGLAYSCTVVYLV